MGIGYVFEYMSGELRRILPLEVSVSLSRAAIGRGTLLSLPPSGYSKVQSTSYSIINLQPSILKLWAVVSQWSVGTDLNKPHILGRNFSRYIKISMLANEINNNFKVF